MQWVAILLIISGLAFIVYTRMRIKSPRVFRKEPGRVVSIEDRGDKVLVVDGEDRPAKLYFIRVRVEHEEILFRWRIRSDQPRPTKFPSVGDLVTVVFEHIGGPVRPKRLVPFSFE